MSAQETTAMFYGTTKSYQIPLEHLDYRYIENSSDVKHLEKILRVLRSGEEGNYPELTAFCEKRIENLAPHSRALRKDKPPATAADFTLEDWQHIDKDLKEWFTEIKKKDQQESVFQRDTEHLPSVRSFFTFPADSKHKEKEKIQVLKKVPRDYKEWDRFDVEKELSQTEKNMEKKKEETNSKTTEIKKTIDTTGIRPEQRKLIADNEKEKGNEAFRCGDYKEAIVYYSRSLSVLPTIAAYNNRAQAEIKLKNWHNALMDCVKVLDLDAGNVKAYLRRATVHRNLGNHKEALRDLKTVLNQEPDNPLAKKSVAEVEALLQKEEKEIQRKGRKIVIQDIEGSDEEYEGHSVPTKEAGVSEGGEPVGERTEMGNANNAKSFPGKNLPKFKEIGNPKQETPAQNGVNKDCSNGKQPKNKCEDQDRQKQCVPAPQAEDRSESGSKEVKPSSLPLTAATKLKSEGNQLFKNGQFGEATIKYSEAIENGKNSGEQNAEELAILYSNRAACHLKDGNCRECIEDCNRALELQPFSVKPLLRRAMANETLERYRPAYVDFKTALQIDRSLQIANDSINRITRTLIEQDGPNWREKLPPVPTVPVSIHLQEHGEVSESNSNNNNSNNFVHPLPAVQGRLPDEQLQALKKKGNECVKTGQYREAVKNYTECLMLNSEECTLYTNRALCYLKLSQYEEARNDCESALQRDNVNVKALYRRAQAFRGLKEYQKCASDLQRVILLDPGITEAKKQLEEVTPFLNSEDCTENGQRKQRKKIQIQEVDETDENTCNETSSTSNHCNTQEGIPPFTTKARSPIQKPSNAHEFDQLINEIKAMKDEALCAELLSIIEPKDLPLYLSSKLEGDTIPIIVQALKHYLLDKNPNLVYQHLLYLSKAERFKVTVLFLNKSEKDEIKDLVQSLSGGNVTVGFRGC
ncbi:hypothetical protein GDO86_010840 [Hymenochirus boettgeri]|uniref:RNA-polymerase II-associated protein 3-like C-terminal domain-containing protein n=1 Tax=Hymenochirus boettgeri TaxID=247094 RepID=A0A8T2JEU5_9PIPI|nr:hypothetical protein GDO86_010840 [Hymenochirus boettgeri]